MRQYQLLGGDQGGYRGNVPREVMNTLGMERYNLLAQIARQVDMARGTGSDQSTSI